MERTSYSKKDGRHYFDRAVSFELAFTKHFFERANERLGLNKEDAQDIVLDYLDIPSVQDLIFDDYSTSEVKNGVDFVLYLEDAQMEIACFLKEFLDGYVVVTKTCLPIRAWVPSTQKKLFTSSCLEGGALFA